ncbi:MAG TPA: Gfo/Idh/MocA family oxidoreductase [Candidatus Dormibacteraeota bacterium]|nr:Gfo/Idh/MocA family oxidoreductase [Candidatus Dormibacteraeota bacterium]
MIQPLTRRRFLKTSSLALAGGALITSRATAARKLSANDKLNLGIIGTAHRAAEDIHGVQGENIVALCDIDENLLAAAKQKFPGARTYTDFRQLLEQKDIDAVVVATADHTHAVATSAALHLGKHVYCEKPLTHSVAEARAIAKLAAKHPSLATQMGTQIHASQNYRRTVELVQSGAIGAVRECHVWCEKRLANSDRPADMPAVPPNIHWDLWLGPAPARAYHPAYLPKTWRHWWDFGEGILGDMACHYMDLPFWALELKYPESVEAEGPPIHPETTPEWLIVHYQFPARQNHPPLALTWYDGGKKPELLGQGKAPAWPNGVLFVGDKGMLIADYHQHKLLPEAQFAGFQSPPKSIPDSIGHHNEWILACETGSPTTCNFAYGSVLTEAVLLGNVAFRTGHKLEWDGPGLRVKNSEQAKNYLMAEYRRGWQLAS